ncbi:helix-turn-helix transcriptional regulator [Nocardia sp. NPDC050793]|uniref:helix-turn-helix transcriptional regulator n=1 Tax=Nocardia sp. NPDC050793 TaxID=3155159 RepID=UPI0033EB214B
MVDGRTAGRWRGVAALRPGRLVIVGQIGTAALHAHHTVQVIVAAEDMVLADRAGERVVCRAAVVPPDVAHAVVRGASHGAVVHLDPESAPGTRWAAMARPRDSAHGWACAAAELRLDVLSEWLRVEQGVVGGAAAGLGVAEGATAEPGGGAGATAGPGVAEGAVAGRHVGGGASAGLDVGEAASAEQRAVEETPTEQRVGREAFTELGVSNAAGRRGGAEASTELGVSSMLTEEAAAFVDWVRSARASESEAEWLRVGAAGEAVRHPAVAEVLRLLPERMSAGPVRLAELARAVHLSESRLAHVFSAELGLPFRPYLRWLRIQRAAELLAAGHSLTEVAHRAGFADSAHLTRVCRSMFGAPPSEFNHLNWNATV